MGVLYALIGYNFYTENENMISILALTIDACALAVGSNPLCGVYFFWKPIRMRRRCQCMRRFAKKLERERHCGIHLYKILPRARNELFLKY